MISGRDNVFTRFRPGLVTMLGLCLLSTACVKYDYEAKPIDAGRQAVLFASRNLDDTGLREFIGKYGYGADEWPRESWDLQGLTLAAYYFNPQLQVAVARHNKSLINEEIATLYPNPGIQFPFEHHSDTSGGVSPWLIGVVLDLVFEREGKRQARLEHARAESDVTRIGILRSAWQIYRSVRDAYLGYYDALSTRKYLQGKLELIEEIVSILSRSYELGQTSEFELNTMRLELQKIRLELVNQEVQIRDALHKLAGEIGVPVTEIEGEKLDFAEVDLYLATRKLDNSRLQGVALTHRLDMQHAMSEYAAYEAALKLEIEKQYPDITLSPGFVFDQNDNIWALGASWILPLFHPHNEGPVKLALADREIKQAEIISLQSGIINEIKLADSRLESVANALDEARHLIQEARHRNRQLRKQFELGQIDNLVLLRNKLELLSIRGALLGIRSKVVDAATNYEDAVQYPLLDIPGYRIDSDMKTNNAPVEHNEDS